jgi:hypothetical protein
MVRSSEERNRQLDAMEARRAEQSRALTEVLTELVTLRRAAQD